MFRSLKQSLPLLVAAASVVGVAAIPKITRSGRYLYDDTGSRFYIKGIAYQPQGEVVASSDNAFLEPSTFTDPLADANGCNRDLQFLKDLSVNAIRVYSVDSGLNHDACMQALSGAGIYTIIDLSLPLNGSIDRDSPSWSTNLLDQYTRTIDAFSKYDNVLAYTVGNEVVNGTSSTTAAMPYVKAAARDIKAYLKSKSVNALVAYASIDSAKDLLTAVADYLSCDTTGGNSDSTSIDLFGLNNYEWCGDDSFQSAYASTVTAFQGYNVAAYFSEYGCITSPPRLWTEVASLFGSDMTPEWSGGIAFSYFPAQSAQGQFGMVNISADGSTVTTSDDYNKLKAQYNSVSFINSPSQSSSAASSYPSCAAPTDQFLASNSLPPTPNESACDCLENVLSCRFTPVTANYSVIVGELIGTACSLLGQNGANCDDIGSNGQTGTYGRLSGCDPTIKLSYTMSKFYESQNRNEQACSFAGNGTVNTNAPSSASAADSAASSCISNPAATFAPSSAPSSGSTGSTNGNGGSTTSSGSGGSGSGALSIEPSGFLGLAGMAAVALASVIFTLA